MSPPNTSRPSRLLVTRDASARNVNAQAKNAQNILRHWSSTTWRPSIFSFAEPDAALAANDAVDIIPLRPGPLWRLDFFGAYLSKVDAIFYPGMHEWFDQSALAARRAIGRKVPVIATIEGLLGDAQSSARADEYSALAGHKVYCQDVGADLLRRIDRMLHDADHLIAISPFLARMAEARYGPKVTMIPLGVDRIFGGAEPGPPRARMRVLCAGSVNARKRPETFLAMARRFPQADFAWFGDGPLRAGLVKAASESGVANIAFPGPVGSQDLAGEFATADILVLPAFAEGVPKITQEAAASGMAQIIFGFYEAPTVVEGRNGYVVWNDDELADRLGALLSDRDLTAAMGQAGREMATDWSWEVIARRWETCIIDVLGTRQ